MNVHIVVKGDTLWKIARQYGISFDELKKVNAHLANPDYIVPGMKIFLPDGGKGTKPHGKQPPKDKVPHHEKPHYEKPQHEKPPQEKPHSEKPVMPQPKPQPPVPPVPKPQPVPPAPKPLPPKPEVKPVPKPEVKPAPQPKPQPPVPKPQPERPKPEKPVCEMPPAPPQLPPMPQPPIVQPMMIGIPCGWMPIYDADCHPHAHQYYPPAAQPLPQQPQQPVPYPSVPPTLPQQMIRPPHWSHLPESPSMPDCGPEESPVMPGQCPGNSPSHWEHEHRESSAHHHSMNGSSNFELAPPAYCPPEQGYVPQPVQPPAAVPQMMQGIQAAQHPQYMHLCTSCGSQMTPYPYYGLPPFYAPVPYQQTYPSQSVMPLYGPDGDDTMGTY